MRLTDLKPKWWAAPGRVGQGVLFLCPHCKEAWLCAPFRNPIDGGQPWELRPSPKSLWEVIYPVYLKPGTLMVPPGHLWLREGDDFDTLTLSPSVDASRAGCWHGFVRNGEVR